MNLETLATYQDELLDHTGNDNGHLVTFTEVLGNSLINGNLGVEVHAGEAGVYFTTNFKTGANYDHGDHIDKLDDNSYLMHWSEMLSMQDHLDYIHDDIIINYLDKNNIMYLIEG